MRLNTELYGDREVEGWTNYATWNISLHVKNDQGWYDHWTKMLADYNEITPAAAFEIALEIFPHGWTPDKVHIGHPGINWDEIAEAWAIDKAELATA